MDANVKQLKQASQTQISQ